MALQFHRKPGLVAYITCGDPDLATSREVVLSAIRAGADIIELGVPFSDPVADGPVIQRASERALRGGTTLADVLNLAKEIRAQAPRAGLLVFSYLNPLVRLGLQHFADTAKAAGVDGVLVTDLPVEEAGEYLPIMRKAELDTVFLAAPTSPDERLNAICEASRGFVYAVSRTGVTGTRQEIASDASSLVSRIRDFTKLPVAVGFGISNAQQFAEVTSFADAAIVGSGIVQVIERAEHGREAEAVYDFIGNLLHGAGQAAQSTTK
ncbi:MAG TPA: tryptophan synthase subunit alpha [Terriglobales bacterium]|nr:tryptophan synthase subunit alpha [Terriglobales bacterium]